MADKEPLIVNDGKECSDCGIAIGRKSTRCRPCHCRLQNAKPVSLARREAMSLRAMGNRYGAGNAGKPKTALHKARMSQSHRGQHAGVNVFGYRQTAQHRENNRQGQRKQYQNPKALERQARILEKARQARDFSPQARQRMAERAAVQLQRWPKPVTKLERSLYSLLANAGFCFEREKRFGRYIVDAFVPSHNLVFEADGFPWHQDKDREAKRDSYLMKRGALAVIHLVDDDLEVVF